MDRKLASVRKIIDIQSIPGADAIDVATVDGWQVVVNKGQFQVGDMAVYLETDSWVPQTLAPFLCKAVKSFNGVEGERLRTVKLRGQLSQGLLLPLQETMQPYTGFRCWAPGDNVTEVLGIQKYEKPISPQVAGQAKGHFPSFLRKTDQERIQNLTLEFHVWKTLGYTWEVTEKLDGSSMTMFYKDGKFGVCSRNLELIEDEKNTFWRVARESGFASEHDEDSQEIAVQGELVGPGIQGNPYELTTHRLYVFNLWEINPGEYAVPRVCRATVAADEGFNHVPIIATNQTLPATIAEVLEMADGQSMVGPGAREGVVWKCEQDPSISFKAISNKWLLKQKD